MDAKTISLAGTAKMIRAALKRSFPSIKFTVRGSKYSGGASIDISWTDGPLSADVDAIVKNFQGAGFDGMIDLRYSKRHWLLPDSSVALARSEGTVGSGGAHGRIDNAKPHPDAVLVEFAADYVHCSRDYSQAFMQRRAESIAHKYGLLRTPEVVAEQYRNGKLLVHAYVRDEYDLLIDGKLASSIVHRACHKTRVV